MAGIEAFSLSGSDQSVDAVPGELHVCNSCLGPARRATSSIIAGHGCRS